MATDADVANARMAGGIGQLLRCGSLDGLPDRFHPQKLLGPFDASILDRAGLILDLRSSSERNDEKARTWMTSTNETFSAHEFQDLHPYPEKTLMEILHQHGRLVARLDILSPIRFMNYIEKNWLSPQQRAQANQWRHTNKSKLHSLRMEALNERGLLGLNEAILETGKQGLYTALQLLTLHFESILQSTRSNSFDLAVIHCVQGKDRTGMLVMLCQALVGVPDRLIIEDYAKSHNNFRKRTQQQAKSAAAVERIASTTPKANPRVKLARSMWNSAPPSAMDGTLKYLKMKYGSISPGYLNSTGFDEKWQRRFQSACSALSASSGIAFQAQSKL